MTAKKKPEDDSTSDDKPSVKMVEIPFGGFTFTVPKDRDDWDTRAIIAFSRSRALVDQIRGIELQLGPANFALLVEKAAPTAGPFRKFTDLFFETVKNECVN